MQNVLVVCLFLMVTSPNLSAQTLSEEGRLRKSAHDFLIQEFVTDRPAKFVNNGTILSEVTVLQQRIEADGQLRIELPDGAQRVASMFRHLSLRGEHLDRVGDLRLLPYKPDSTLHHSRHTPELYRVQMGALPLPRANAAPIILQATTTGPVVVTDVVFSSQGKLPVTFDDLPYRNLGDEQPPEAVRVTLDPTRELSLGGITDLQREKFFRYYAAPGTVHGSLEEWAHTRHFRPGRQIFKMQYALVQGYSVRQPRLVESAERPGSADLSFFDRFDAAAQSRHAIPAFREIDYAMCLDNWPAFMSLPHVGRGTPRVEHFDAAAELAGAYVGAQAKAGGTAAWWEVKNESTIKAEWDYHWADNSWDLLADFHNRVADEIHQQSPGTRVGGPSSAWMQLQVNDFGLYRSQRQFMDDTKDHLDFYSHHFYEDIGTVGAWHRRQTTYTNYLLGRVDAILNMLQAHMHGTGHVKPLLTTECGSLQPGRGPSDYWLRLRSFSAYLHKFLQRPHQIDLCVPFAFLNVPWNPASGNAAFIPRAGSPPNGPRDGYEPTPVTHFFDLWRDFDGRRIPVTCREPWLDVSCVHQGLRLCIALTNMSGRRRNVHLVGLAEGQVASASQRRLYYRDGQIVYKDRQPLSDLTAVEVDVEETTIVIVELHQPLSISDTTRRTCAYAAETAVRLQGKKSFSLAVDEPATVKRARLIVGVHRDGGLRQPLDVACNGQSLTADHAWASEFRHLFAPLTFEISATALQDETIVEIAEREGVTITSVHLELDR